MALVCFVGTACSTTPPTGKALFEDARGTVFLQPISDRSFQANHPISLEPALIARLLSGVLVQEQQRALQAVLAGSSSAVPVFSAEEIQVLAPQLARALATAATNQEVGFLVTNRRPGNARLEYSTTETTAGSLYTYGLSLYISLSQYRFAPARTNTEHIAHRSLRDTSGLSDHALLFTPSFAQRSENLHRPATGATDKFLAIDYQLLQPTPPSATVSEQAAPRPEGTNESPRQDVPVLPPSQSPLDIEKTLAQRDDEVRQLKDLIVKKDLELDAVKQELQSIRRQLDGQITRQDNQKRKHKPPSKSQ